MKKIALLISACFFVNVLFAQETPEIKTIKQNYISILLYENQSEQDLINKMVNTIEKEAITSDQMVVELMQRFPIDNNYIKNIVATITENGQWADIDYNDKKRSGWSPKTHTERILDLARAYRTEDSEFKDATEVEKAIRLSMDYWFKAKHVCPNWWYNQIGIPKTLGAAFILFEHKLTEHELKSAIEVMENAKFGMTGQNKVWLAGNVLVKALLQNNYTLIKEARDIIISEITTGQKEGIKEDYSFHQHGAQQQFGNYGAAYISSMSFWSNMFAETSFSFSRKELDILGNLINNGYRRVLWKGNMDVSALGRQLFINVQEHKALSTVFSANALLQVDKVNSPKYKELIKDNTEPANNKYPELYHFWQSDYTVFRKPNYMVSVKMSSPRVIGSEMVNGDNLLGYYLAEGATYTYVDGDEYRNIFPCWDWRKIPGITAYEDEKPPRPLNGYEYHNKNSFVGNVTDGTKGITAMHLNRDKLTGKKAWFFTNNFVVCMGAGIKSDSALAVTTTIEQNIQGADMFPFYFPTKKALRYHSGKTGYIVLKPTKNSHITTISTQKWNNVMSTYPDSLKESARMFTAWINHGISPQKGKYTYIILPDTDPFFVRDYDLSNIKIIKNTANVQAIFVPAEKTTYISAYKPTKLKVNEISFKTNSPGLFLIKETGENTEVWISDPTQELTEIEIVINNKTQKVILPTGNYKGTSVKYLF